MRTRIIKRRLVKTRKVYSEREIGQAIGKLAVALWKSQKNTDKVYVGGYRVHHGPVGILMTLIGAYYNEPALVGFGEEVFKDDIDDLPYWFDFERQPSSIQGFA